jgi:hypothetical protein
MSPLAVVALLALTGYAVYQQTRRHEVVGGSRFKLAIIYGIVGFAVGGFSRPDSGVEWLLLVVSLGLSAAVGLARGKLTRLWTEDGRVWSQGTPQAELIRRRAEPPGARTSDKTPAAG